MTRPTLNEITNVSDEIDDHEFAEHANLEEGCGDPYIAGFSCGVKTALDWILGVGPSPLGVTEDGRKSFLAIPAGEEDVEPCTAEETA